MVSLMISSSMDLGSSTGTRRVLPSCWLYCKAQASVKPLVGLHHFLMESALRRSHTPSSLWIWGREGTVSRVLTVSMVRVGSRVSTVREVSMVSHESSQYGLSVQTGLYRKYHQYHQNRQHGQRGKPTYIPTWSFYMTLLAQ